WQPLPPTFFSCPDRGHQEVVMAGKAPLRAVKADEKPDEKAPATGSAKTAKQKTLLEAIEGGDYLEILEAQRRDVVASLPTEKGPAKAALHRQLSILSKE